MTTEDRATTSTSPSSYNPNMGLKAGRVTELRIFFHVKPGHAEQLKEACRKFVGSGARTSIENVLRSAFTIRASRCSTTTHGSCSPPPSTRTGTRTSKTP